MAFDRVFTVTTPIAYRLSATLGGTFGTKETFNHVRLHTISGGFPGPPFANRDTPGSQTFNGMLAAGDYLFDASIGCSPDFDGGTCTGNMSFSLELGDLIGP